MLASVKTKYSKLATRSPGLSLQDPEKEFLDERSYRGKTWKPYSIRPIFLALFICFCLTLTVVVELLLKKSRRNGGLFFRDLDRETLPIKADILFNYLPTTISVVFGLFWASADHNFKRLEPFFQLSKPEGATAEQSLLLDYSYSFQLFVPYKSFKKRHWAVCCSSLVMTITGFFLTPSMSGIFDLVTTYKYQETTEVQRANLRSAQDLNKALSTEPSYLARNIVFLGGALPEFTTKEYAILPFQNPKEVEVGDRWTGETILYEADLGCRDAKMFETRYGYNITNEEDCSYHFVLPRADLLEILSTIGLSEHQGNESLSGFPATRQCPYNLFMGYPNNTRDRSLDLFSLSSPLASCSDSRKLLITREGYWMPSLSSFGPNVKPAFCKPTYWSQPVNATIEMTKSGVVNIVKVDRQDQRTPFKEFNITSFEELVVTGRASPPTKFGDFPLYSPEVPSRDESPKLNPRSLESLEMDFETAFKLLFALTVHAGFVDHSQNSTTIINGTRLYDTQAYIANELWCRLSQGGFGVLSFLTLILLTITWNRKCNLDGEPNSLAALMQTLSQSAALRKKMESSEFRHPIDQSEYLIESKSTYRLRLLDNQGPYIQVTDVKGRAVELEDLYSGPAQKSSLAPVEMVWGPIGFLYTFYFTILLSLLLFVFISDKMKGGLRFSEPESSFRYKLIFSHLPTIFGTSTEPLWVLIGTYACMVAPYEILRRGRAPSSKTLTIDYDKTPPHFQTFQALKARNFGLAALTIATILANFLAVAFGGLFSPRPVGTVVPAVHRPYFINISGDVIIDENRYTLLATNVSGNDSFHSWIAPDFFVIPFNWQEWESSTLSIESREALAFGTNVSCELLPENKVSIVENPKTSDSMLEIDHKCWTEVPAQESTCQGFCWNESSTARTGFLIDSDCPGTFFVGWAEPPSQPTNSTEATVLVCNSSMIAAEVSVTVYDGFQIISYNVLKTLAGSDVESMISETNYSKIDRAVAFDDAFQKSIIQSSNMSWIDIIMANIQPNVRQLGNATEMPDVNYVAEAFESAYRQLHAVYTKSVYSNMSLYKARYGDRAFKYSTTYRHYRVYVSAPMFGISLGVMIFFLLLILWVHVVRPGRGLTHLPRSMAETFTLLYASDIIEDCTQLQGRNTRARARQLNKMGNTYGYGHFTAPDGEEHFGVHKDGLYGIYSPSSEASSPAETKISLLK